MKEVDNLLVLTVFNLFNDIFFELRKAYEILVGRSEDNTPLARSRN
jgi:hypothetical protein